MDEKQIKAYKRLFKELGVYNAFMHNRNIQVKKSRIKCDKFWDLPRKLKDLLYNSFVWLDSGTPKLWDDFSKSISGDYTAVEILYGEGNDLLIKELKKICNEILT